MKSHAKYLIPTLTLLLVFLVLSMSNAPDPMEGGGRGPSSVPMLPERSIWDGIKNLLKHHEAEVLAQGYIPATGGQGVYPTSGTFSVGIQNTPGVLVQNTVYVTGVPAGGGGGGTVFVRNTAGVAVVSMPSMIVTGTVNVNIVAGAVSGGTVFVNNPNQSPIPIATGSANFFVNVQAGATIPVSVPTIGVAINTAGIIAIPTQSYDVNVKNTPGVAVQNTVQVATSTLNVAAWVQNTVYVTGVPAGSGGGGTVFVNNPSQSPIPIATGSANMFMNVNASQATVNVQALSTIAVSVPTIGVQPGTVVVTVPTTWVQGTISALTYPGATIPVSLPTIGVQPGTVFVTVPTTWVQGTVQVGAHTVFVATSTINAAAWIQNTPAIQGSVSINNTPAIQGSVSINNTPAIQGSVSINNTPAVLLITPVAMIPNPTGTAPVAVLPTTSADNVNSWVAKTSAGNLYHYTVTNEGTTQLWAMAMNTAGTPGATATAVAPEHCFTIGSKQSVIEGIDPPMNFSNGIVWLCSSTSCGSWTASANCWFESSFK